MVQPWNRLTGKGPGNDGVEYEWFDRKTSAGGVFGEPLLC